MKCFALPRPASACAGTSGAFSRTQHKSDQYPEVGKSAANGARVGSPLVVAAATATSPMISHS